MKETFQSFENKKSIPIETTPTSDESWTRSQIKEMITEQEEGRQQQFEEARGLALETALSPANYVKELLELELEPEELSRFSSFFNEIGALKNLK